MRRRTYLATAGTGTVASLSGCLGEGTDRRPKLEIQRGSTGESGECAEQELLDFERAVLAPKAAGLVGLESAVRWELDLRPDEELYLRITNPDMDFLPHLSVIGPDDTAIIDERPVDNIYTVRPETDGRHVIEVSNRRWTEGGDWFVDLIWYSATSCR